MYGSNAPMKRFSSVVHSPSNHLIERTGVEIKKEEMPFTMNFKDR